MDYKNLIAFILLIILLIFKTILLKKCDKKNTIVCKKEKIINIVLIIVGFFVFLIDLILNLNKDMSDAIRFINALVITMVVLPFDWFGLYRTMFNDEEKYCNVKTIVTDRIDSLIVSKFNKAHINIIMIVKKINDTKYKVIKEDKVEKSLVSKTIVIDSDNIKLLDKWLDKRVTVYETNDLDNLYDKIMESRMVYDNYLRIIKYLIISFVPIILSYFLLTMEGFPFIYNLLLIVILKIIIYININLLYKKLPYDKDISERYSKNPLKMMNKQELLFTIVNSFIILMVMTIPYTFILSYGGDIKQAFTLYLVIYVFANIFSTYSMINDSFIIKILYNNIKNVRLWIYTIIMVLMTMLIYFTNIFDTINMGLQNYLVCMGFGFSSICLNEMIKIARYLKKRKVKKNVKNN